MMNRIVKQVLVAAASVILVGCASPMYKPNVASDNQLSAYAGQANYPRDVTPKEAPHLFCSVSQGPVITIYNAGDETYSGFEVWVNQMYTLHVEKLDAKSMLQLDPKTIFNKTGVSIDGAPATSINTIEVQMQDKLWTVQGPILPH